MVFNYEWIIFDAIIQISFIEMASNIDFKQVIIQPNAVTNARYDFSQMQKDFMYHFIEKMSKYMTKEFTPIADLFGNITIEMDLKDIVKADNYTPMLEAIQDLLKKPIYYHFTKDNDTYDVRTTLIAAIISKRRSGKIWIKTTEESLPFLSYLGAGFTSLNKRIALDIPSYYGKRMYEICCRWQDKGFYRISIKDFRKMMMIEDKFKLNADMARGVLDMSERLLSQHADLTFSYTFRKENGSRAFNWLELNIVPTAGESGEKQSGWYSTLYNMIYDIFRDTRACAVCDYLTEQGELKRATERFSRLKTDIKSGRIKGYGLTAYINKIFMDEYKVPENLLESSEMKKKRKKAEAKLVALKKKKEADELKKTERIQIAAERIKKPENLFKGLLNTAAAANAAKSGDLNGGKSGGNQSVDRGGDYQSIKEIISGMIQGEES